MRDFISQEFFDGYCDGTGKDTPAPSGNRTAAYIHSFNIARHEQETGEALYPAWQAITKAQSIRVKMEKDLVI